MPFTFCHPAAVVPFRKLSPRYFSLTGLAAGSIAPDYEYFLRVDIVSRYGHTFWGMFYLDLPLALLLCFIFHAWVRNSLFQRLPVFIQRRVYTFQKLNWPAYFRAHTLVVLYSCLLGVMTHLCWDSFTHPSGFAVQHISFLRENILIGTHLIPRYNLLQHLSSLAGGIILAILFFRLPRFPVPVHKKNGKILYWMIVFAVTVTVMGVKLATGMQPDDMIMLAVSGISGCSLGLVLASLPDHLA